MEHPGANLRRIRRARGRSLDVVAGLAGISPSYLSRLERGQRALDRRSLVAALARALDVAPADIVGPSVPVTVETGIAGDQVDAVRAALLAVSVGFPGGDVVPLDTLRNRTSALLDAQRACDYRTVGDELPQLVRDVHSSIGAGRDVRELLRLAALLHVQGTAAWLGDIGGPGDLAWQAAILARDAAHRAEDPVSVATAAFGVGLGLVGEGEFELASRVITNAAPGTADTAGLHLSGMLALARSLTAAASGDVATEAAALDQAADLARHVDGHDFGWFGFGPANVDLWRASAALERGDHATAAALTDRIAPASLPNPTRRVAYHLARARACARIRQRRSDAVDSLRTAEGIAPARVHGSRVARGLVIELIERGRADAVGTELRGLASRAGLDL
ncbi:helix-turn-helix domain-containing protein [Saccharomonospora glauca]|uniref:Putative transcriptional regulator n=1 Tax=Saccharomonospora glauca K62 TaxID=928724 RepID=I1CXC7_9PSEU|nr:helix-turn-helix transcriptional regulator [Saccharomonospora glauca]EIE97351.1 putative transcriptional regulator [Saccharomonospora glauca K62]